MLSRKNAQGRGADAWGRHCAGRKGRRFRPLLTMIHDSLKAGGAGCSIGRNVFEHPRRTQLVQAMRALVHEDADVETALKLVGE